MSDKYQELELKFNFLVPAKVIYDTITNPMYILAFNSSYFN